MKVQFDCDCEIEICVYFNPETEEGDWEQEVFKRGDIVEFDLVDHPVKYNGDNFVRDEDLLNVQFGDGSMAFSISRNWFTVLEE